MSSFISKGSNNLRVALISATTPKWGSRPIESVARSLARFDVQVDVITDPRGLSRVLGDLKNPRSVRKALEAKGELVIGDSDFPYHTVMEILAGLFRSVEPIYPVVITDAKLFKRTLSDTEMDTVDKTPVSVLGGFRRGVVVSSSRSADVHDSNVKERSLEVALRRGIGYLLGVPPDKTCEVDSCVMRDPDIVQAVMRVLNSTNGYLDFCSGCSSEISTAVSMITAPSYA
ncbi:hypothetical protein HYT84_03225 [Candidatus Micrarchaeota archaeon]|nr:hypothetical protein [Candidatus Micrarchaeota archaeon]